MKKRKIEIYKDWSKLEKYKEDWNILAKDNFFLSYEWNTALINASIRADIAYRLMVICVFEEEHLVGAIPLKYESPNWVFLSNYQADYQDFLYKSKNILNAMLVFCDEEIGLCNLQLSDIPETSKTIDYLKENYKDEIVIECSSKIGLVELNSEFFKKKSIKNAQRKLRNLRKIGNVTVEHSNDFIDEIKLFKYQYFQRWGSNQESYFFFEKFDDFFLEELVENFKSQKSIICSKLCIDGNPISFFLGFIHKHTYLFYRTSFEEKYRDYSPGLILLSLLAKEMISNEIYTIDMLRGDYIYKRRYAKEWKKNAKIRWRSAMKSQD